MKYRLFATVLTASALATHSGEVRAQQQTTPQNQGQSNTGTRNQTGTQSGRQPGAPRNSTQPAQSQSSTNDVAINTRAFVAKVVENNQKEIETARLASSRAKSAQVKRYAQQLITDHTHSLNSLQKYASSNNISRTNNSTGNLSSNSNSSRSNSNTTSNTNANAASNSQSNSASTQGRTSSNTQTGNNSSQKNPGQSGRNETPTRSSNPEAMAAADNAHGRDLSSRTGADFDREYIRMMVEDHEKAVALFEQERDAKAVHPQIQAFVNESLPVLRSHLAKAKELQKTVGTSTSPGPDASKTGPTNSRPSTNPAAPTNPTAPR
jgi:putative membrane protein